MKTVIRTLALMVATIILSTSCARKTDNILHHIPADTPLVAKANLEKVLSAFDIKEEKGELVFPDWFPKDLHESAQRLTELRSVVDTQNIFAVIIDNFDQAIVMANVIDDVTLEGYLNQKGEKLDNAAGAPAWALDGIYYLVKDGIVYASTEKPNKTAAFIESAAKAKMTMADCDGVAQALSGDNMFSMAVASPIAEPDKNHDGNVYVVLTADVKDQSLYGTSRSIYADGAPFSTDVAKDINMAALQYVPGNATAVLAMGIDGSKFDGTAVAKQMGVDTTDPMIAAQMAMITSYVKRIDGTVLAAVTPRMRTLSLADILAEDNYWGAFDYMAMIRLSQAELDQTITEITTLLSESGMPYTREDNGLFRIEIMERPVWIGNVDSYLVAATTLPSNNNGSSLAARFNGKVSGLAIDIPVIGIDPNSPVGISIESTSAASDGSYNISFTNTSETFFEALANILNAL